jgi:hypothetical protein
VSVIDRNTFLKNVYSVYRYSPTVSVGFAAMNPNMSLYEEFRSDANLSSLSSSPVSPFISIVISVACSFCILLQCLTRNTV